MKILIYIFILCLILIHTSCREDILEFEKENATIYLRSEPSNARIYLNNTETEKFTPDSLFNLADDYYKITLRRAGYRDTSFTVSFEKTFRKTFNIELTAR